MKKIEVHFIDTRERWWAALSAADRALMIESAKTSPHALPERAASLVITAKSPAALATHVAWEGQQGAWMLTEAGRDFLLSEEINRKEAAEGNP